MTQIAVETPLQVLEHEPFLQVTWRDTVTPARGFVVIDQLVTGIATGGLRMRPGCTIGEVGELAREMTLKMGAFGIHVGGAKGGIDFDSADPRADEVRERFLQAVRPLLEYFWVTAGDLGTQQDKLDQAFARVGMGETSFHAAVVRAADETEVRSRVRDVSAMETDGLNMADLVGGYGVAQAALAALEHKGVPAASARAVVQGFGAMGGSTARYLARAGVRIIGVTDAHGLILNTERGLDVDLLLQARSSGGLIDRTALREDDTEGPGEEWLALDADVLVPAAVSYTITEDNCDQIRGRLVVEAANVPTTPEAERRLQERGVTVVPDFIANTGAAAGAWWVILGEVDTPLGACERLSAQIRPLVRNLMVRADERSTSVRTQALRYAKENSQRMIREYGGAVAFRELYSPTAQEGTLGDTEPGADFPSIPEPMDALAQEGPVEAVILPPSSAVPDGVQPAQPAQPAAYPAYWPGPGDPDTGKL